MPEMREDMLPDEEMTRNKLREEDSNVIEDVEPQTPAAVPHKDEAQQPVSEPVIPKGYVPYDALHAEREKRKVLEAKLKDQQTSLPQAPEIDYELMSDEGHFLKKQLDDTKKELESYKEQREFEKVYALYPEILDKSDEFEEFRAEYPSLSLEKVAKVFRVEKGLAENVPKRKGLESPTAGPKLPTEEGPTDQEITRLMKGDEKQFIKKIRSGAFDKMKFR